MMAVVHSAAPITFQNMKTRSCMPLAPAIQKVGMRTPGTNRMNTSVLPPWRSKNATTRSICTCFTRWRRTPQSIRGLPPR